MTDDLIALLERATSAVRERLRPPADLTVTQALILARLGDTPIPVGWLTLDGIYGGNNVSYNLQKLINLGYATAVVAPSDGRSRLVQLTLKGASVRGDLKSQYAAALALDEGDKLALAKLLGRIVR